MWSAQKGAFQAMGTPRAKALRQEQLGTLREQNEGQCGYSVMRESRGWR